MKHIPLSAEIKRKIRHITLYTKRQMRGMLVGDARSAQKGVGFSFDQIRDYAIGDDVRCIDWAATSRMSTLLVKQYCEERSRTILIALDVSASTLFGSGETIKRDRAAQIAAVLSLVAATGNDLVGLLLFTDEVERYIPPRRGTAHIMALMNEMFSYKGVHKKTDYNALCKRLCQIQKPGWVTCIVSDFIGDIPPSNTLKSLSKRGDIIAIRCLDQRERTIDNVGFLPMQDLETGECILIDARKTVYLHSVDDADQQALVLKKGGIDLLDIPDTGCFVGSLITFFSRRMRY